MIECLVQHKDELIVWWLALTALDGAVFVGTIVVAFIISRR